MIAFAIVLCALGFMLFGAIFTYSLCKVSAHADAQMRRMMDEYTQDDAAMRRMMDKMGATHDPLR